MGTVLVELEIVHGRRPGLEKQFVHVWEIVGLVNILSLAWNQNQMETLIFSSRLFWANICEEEISFGLRISLPGPWLEEF